jgi:tRNA A-37 threonylcarbamoyl transferase component Bud32
LDGEEAAGPIKRSGGEGGIIVMDALSMTLNDDINREPLVDEKTTDKIEESAGEKERKKEIFSHIIELVKNLHSLEISHGDLHFNNFMRDNNGRYYIIDFGKATHSSDSYDKLIDWLYIKESLKRSHYNFDYLEKILFDKLIDFDMIKELKTKRLAFFR